MILWNSTRKEFTSIWQSKRAGKITIAIERRWIHFLSDVFADVVIVVLGNLRNHNGDGEANVKKAIGLMSKTTTLHVYHAICTFLCCPCTTTTWNDQILSLLENGNGKAINSTISVLTRARFPLFSSNQNSLLLSNKANWDNREKILKGCEVYFSATFSRTSPLSDRKVPTPYWEANLHYKMPKLSVMGTYQKDFCSPKNWFCIDLAPF